MSPSAAQWQRPLIQQLAWFVPLRWLAAIAVLGAGAVLARWLDQSEADGRWIAAVGGIILIYNLVLHLVLRRVRAVTASQEGLLALAWIQLLADFAALTTLSLLTGGVASPLLSFFVFHMVFASLLLPRRMAYASASMAMGMVAAGLWISGKWPVELRARVSLLAWATTLLVTVWLANRITRRAAATAPAADSSEPAIRAMSRTLKRQQQAMIQQEKMAAAGQMAAGVAHEIANPLASMDGLLQLMQRRPERLKPEALATLREQVDRINQIVRRMTAFAHPGDGQWQVISPNDVVEKALEVVRFDPRLKRVAVDKALDATLPPVRMVPESIQQVLINLIVNAVDAMESTPEPRLSLTTTGPANGAALSVTDNGVGIAAPLRKRLFEPFFTTKPVGKGTGLGLSISYSLVRQHGGQIGVESTQGQGSTFTVRLPVCVEEERVKMGHRLGADGAQVRGN